MENSRKARGRGHDQPVSYFDYPPEVQENIKERFWRFVLGEPNSGCWFWMGQAPGGYGRLDVGSRRRGLRRVLQAHRVSYEIHKGPIPPGHDLDHTVCRIKLCVNPTHLVPRTHAEHIKQPDSAMSLERARTHCPHGHPYAGDNLRMSKGKRFCRTCDRRASVEQRKGKQHG